MRTEKFVLAFTEPLGCTEVGLEAEEVRSASSVHEFEVSFVVDDVARFDVGIHLDLRNVVLVLRRKFLWCWKTKSSRDHEWFVWFWRTRTTTGRDWCTVPVVWVVLVRKPFNLLFPALDQELTFPISGCLSNSHGD